MNVGEKWDFCNAVANKYQSGSTTPANFNAFMQRAEQDFFGARTGLPEEYRQGAPIPNVGWQMTQRVTDDLRNFVKDATIMKSTDDLYAYPSDYLVFSTAYYIYIVNPDCGEEPEFEERYLKPCPDSEFKMAVSSSIIQPDYEFPIIGFYEGGFKVRPKLINRIILTYLRKPVTPVFGYTVSGQQVTYDPLTSVQSEFPETCDIAICSRILFFMGINIRETELAAVGRDIQMKGQ